MISDELEDGLLEEDNGGYDAVLMVAFGGPEKPADVIPFLENVLAGRSVPPERLREVASHYEHVGGASPINAQVHRLKAALESELSGRGLSLPLYWGNRNWNPYLADVLAEMAAAGIRRALGVALSAYSSYSGCRRYLEDIEKARGEVGAGAPRVDKVRVFYNHPGFIAANAERVRKGMMDLPAPARPGAPVVFTAHSQPLSMAAACDYEAQVRETSRLVAEGAGIAEARWSVAWQSRSGRPEDPWLSPDIGDRLEALKNGGARAVIVHPVGFLSDHVEVLYDLDVEAKRKADALGLVMARSATVGTHPRFVTMLGDLLEERMRNRRERKVVGRLGPGPDVCAPDCCPSGGARA
jgi:ferrochelatase